VHISLPHKTKATQTLQVLQYSCRLLSNCIKPPHVKVLCPSTAFLPVWLHRGNARRKMSRS